MRTSKLLLIVAVLIACRDPEPLEKLPAPAESLTPLDPREVPPPPPPPPPPRAEPMPPPRAVLTFLEANIECSEPWTAAVLELGAPRRGAKQFLGHRIKRRRAIAPPLAKELAQRLGEKTSYSTGDYGCYGDPFGIEIACGAATFQLIADCGHVVLEPEDEDHRIFSESMIELLRKLRGRP